MDDYGIAYGWECSCGDDSFITFTDENDAIVGAEKHLAAPDDGRYHRVRVVSIAVEPTDDGPEW